MPTVKGPLLSVAASGSFRDLLVFKTGPNGSTVSQPQRLQPRPSPAQTAHRAIIKALLVAWRQLDPGTKAAWITYAATIDLTGYNAFWKEWVAQQITAPALPIIPS
jgi:hypothetical protein